MTNKGDLGMKSRGIGTKTNGKWRMEPQTRRADPMGKGAEGQILKQVQDDHFVFLG